MTKDFYPWHQMPWDLAIANGMDPEALEIESSQAHQSGNWEAGENLQELIYTGMATKLFKGLINKEIPACNSNGHPLDVIDCHLPMKGPGMPYISITQGNLWLKNMGYEAEFWEPEKLPIESGPRPKDATVLSQRLDPIKRRRDVLEMFRAAGGKRPKEGRSKGTRGALQRVVEQTGIDKDTLAKMLDKAIEEKRGTDRFAQLTAKP